MSVSTLQERPPDRQPLMRAIFIWTPPAGVVTAVWLTFSVGGLISGNVGAIFPVVLLGLFSGALWFQAMAAWRDLRRQPTVIRGPVQRIWRKGVLLGFFPSHYLQVQRKIFAVEPSAWTQLGVNSVIEIEYWPHTHQITQLRLYEGRDAEALLLPPSSSPSPAV